MAVFRRMASSTPADGSLRSSSDNCVDDSTRAARRATAKPAPESLLRGANWRPGRSLSLSHSPLARKSSSLESDVGDSAPAVREKELREEELREREEEALLRERLRSRGAAAEGFDSEASEVTRARAGAGGSRAARGGARASSSGRLPSVDSPTPHNRTNRDFSDAPEAVILIVSSCGAIPTSPSAWSRRTLK